MQNFADTRYETKHSPFGKNYREDIKYILNSIKNKNLPLDEKIISEALELCFEIHKNKKLCSGEPEYVYYYSLALILVDELQLADTSMIVAALLYTPQLYDCTLHNSQNEESSKNNFEQILREKFDDSTNKLIFELSKIGQHENSSEVKYNQAEIYRNLFLAIAKDIRIFIIKLCDRLYTLRTLEYLPKNKQVEIAEDILNFYAPFSHRLGLPKLQSELEARSFYFLDNPLYTQILEFIAEKKKEFSEYMFMFIDEIRDILETNNFRYKLETIHKQEYEIFLLLTNGKKIEEITDLFSLEIILYTEKNEDCHNAYNALFAKINSLKKTTDYLTTSNEESLHSVAAELYTPNGIVKIIIRTMDMKLSTERTWLTNNNSEIGSYNSYNLLNISDEDAVIWGNWMKNIIETKGVQATQIIWNSIKNNVFEKTITVYSRDNQAIQLPINSTLIDFAFHISKETGLHIITGKTNNTIKNIFSKLNDGDVVEIITSNKCRPDYSWLNHIVSFRATCYLHEYFKTNYKLKTTHKSNITHDSVEFSTIHVCGIKKSNFLNSLVSVIGQETIRRIRLVPDSMFFEVAIDTNKLAKETANLYFSNIFKLQGVKKVCIS